MGKVILICGKICSGKTYYSKQLKKQESAVILSCDEIAFDLSFNTIEDSEKHDEIMEMVKKYFRKKAVEIVTHGTNVILESGFWGREERQNVSQYFKELNISYEWHYIDISDEDWKINIKKRNQLVCENKENAYYLDEGLLEKLLSRFEQPSKNEIDIWFVNRPK
jgi:predicted kinase